MRETDPCEGTADHRDLRSMRARLMTGGIHLPEDMPGYVRWDAPE